MLIYTIGQEYNQQNPHCEKLYRIQINLVSNILSCGGRGGSGRKGGRRERTETKLSSRAYGGLHMSEKCILM